MSAIIDQQSSLAIDFEEFFLQHHQRLIACGLALTGSVDTARDAAQETMVRAYCAWSSVQTMEYPAAWLRKVLLNLVADEGRRSGRAQPATHDATWKSDIAAHEVPTELLAAIRALPQRQRHAVVLRYLDDLSVAEVAAAMGVASGTVKATLFHARAALATSYTRSSDD